MPTFDRACTDFRARLTAALGAGPEGGHALSHAGRPLAWHEHLFACTACRDLLAAEEALEELLRSLPEPRLPVALARRVLRRLATPEQALDAVLDRGLGTVDAAEVPAGLADRVLAGLTAARAADPLDRLLERLPEPEVPTGLTDGVLAAARLEGLLDKLPEPRVPVGLPQRVVARTVGEPVGRPVVTARPLLRWLAPAAAAALLLVVAGRFLTQPDPVRPERPGEERIATGPEVPGVNGGAAPGIGNGELVAAGPDEPEVPVVPSGPTPEVELLDSLDLLEDWELLMADDVDLLLGSLDEFDQELLLLAAVDEEQG